MIVLNRVRALSTKQKVIAGVSAAVVVAAGVGIGVAATQRTSSRPVAASASPPPTPPSSATSTPRPKPKPKPKPKPVRPTNPFTGMGAPPAGAVIAVKIDDTFNGARNVGSTRQTSCTSNRRRPG